MRVGLLVILFGALYLLKALGYIFPFQWEVLWPTIVLLVGIAMVLRSKTCCRWCGCDGWCARTWKKGAVCDCDCDSCGESKGRGKAK